MSTYKHIRYIHIVVGRVSNLLGRSISNPEWGRIGKIIKQYREHSIEEALNYFEGCNEKNIEYRFNNINVFQKVVSLIDSGDYPDREKVFEERDKLLEDQEKGKQLLKDLTSGK